MTKISLNYQKTFSPLNHNNIYNLQCRSAHIKTRFFDEAIIFGRPQRKMGLSSIAVKNLQSLQCTTPVIGIGPKKSSMKKINLKKS